MKQKGQFTHSGHFKPLSDHSRGVIKDFLISKNVFFVYLRSRNFIQDFKQIEWAVTEIYTDVCTGMFKKPGGPFLTIKLPEGRKTDSLSIAENTVLIFIMIVCTFWPSFRQIS